MTDNNTDGKRDEQLVHIARMYGTKYRHAVGMWTNTEHTRSVTARSLCGGLRSVTYIGIDDRIRFALRYPSFFPADSDIWPDCKKCATSFWAALQDMPAMCAGCGRDENYGESCICYGEGDEP